MKTSEQRILTTHVGSLPRTEAVVRLLDAREGRAAYDAAEFDRTIRQAVLDIVKRQTEIGIDVVSDGETSKISYATYVHDRLSGFSDEGTPWPAEAAPRCRGLSGVSQENGAVHRWAALQARHLRRPDQGSESRSARARSRQHARGRRRGKTGRSVSQRRVAWRGRELFAQSAITRRTRPISRPSPTRCRRNMRQSRTPVFSSRSIAPTSPCHGTPAFRI